MAQQDMGLFGPSAAEVQRALDDRARLSNLEQAKLDPYQSIRLSMANYGTAAGKAIGGLFGIEDPALKEATEMDAVKKVVASQWDGSDPEKALELFVQEANKRGLTQQALSASERLTKMKADREKAEQGKVKTSYEIGKIAAQTQEALRKAQQAAAAKVPSLIQYQEARDAIDDALQTEQDPQVRTRLETRKKELDNYINKESTREPKDKTPPSVGSDREAIAQEIYGKGFYDLAPAEKAVVNKRADELAERRKPSLSVTLLKNLKSIGDVREQFNTNVKPYVTAANAAANAEAMIDQASQGNFQGWRAAITQLAKSVGDSQISRAEIEAYGIDPSLVGSIVDRTSIFFSGTPSQDTIKGAKKIANLVKKVNQDRAIQEQGTFLELAKQAEGYNPNTAPRFFELPFSPTIAVVKDQGVQEGTTSSGTKYKLTIK